MRKGPALLFGACLGALAASAAPASADCARPAHAVEAENCLAGSPRSEWDVTGSGDPSLQVRATHPSVNRGETVSFQVRTTATAYRIDIYRLGYYQGHGARLVATLSSPSWAVPPTAVSGLYLARLVGEPGGVGASHAPFVVRHDGGTSDILVQAPDAPGRDLHGAASMVRWLEKNGYDVSYFTGADAERRGGEILRHRVYLSLGGDDGWSAGRRASLEAARDHTPPVHLVFLGAHRDGALTGTTFGLRGATSAVRVPEADGKMRFWRSTPNVARLAPGAVWAGPLGTLGGEWGEDRDDGARPAGLVRLATRVGEVATHHAVFHKRPSGALVFSAGTRQWSRGLDSSVDMQQATVNLLADMGAQPATLQEGLQPASASTDVVAPVSDVTSPAAGAVVSRLSPVLVEGTASDGAPGQVGGVEVSVDGGLTWHRAEGREAWSYLWTPPADGTYVILSRAVDDSGNLETPGAGRTVAVREPVSLSRPDATALAAGGKAPAPGDSPAGPAVTNAIPPAPGGPILVIASPGNPFSRYYAEILRTEGLNAFAVLDLSAVNATVLSSYDVAILGEMSLSAAQVTMFTTWVNGGGNLIAMRPDKQLASLLGLTDTASTLSEAYLLVNTATPPGQGIVSQTMQYHGTADRYTLAPVSPAAVSVATLYSSATASTPNPAVTLRTVGTGEAAAFAFDLARSVVYTRQGNPGWESDERDGFAPLRSDDMFYGAKAGDSQPDWVNLAKVAIPQADEQQRLLVNLILRMNADKKPLPRFWYFPRGEKAVVVMASDNHGGPYVEMRFEADVAASTPGCSVADWDCIRSTVYLYPDALQDDATAKQWEDLGFEVGLHVNTGCADWTGASLADDIAAQSAGFFSKFPSLAPLATHRTHCIAWSDWATQPQVELQAGIRLDTNYYYWPPGWVDNLPGFFTGSGLPMRFAALDGTLIDVYQATTQMTDESGQSYPSTIDTLLDRAIGSQGYYGVFTANIHTDGATEDQAADIVASAKARGVPVVTAKQLLTWLDGRGSSSFTGITWSGGVLSFGITVGAGANGLQAMVPSTNLSALTRGGVPVSYTTQTIKGTSYAFFTALAGAYQASYGSLRTLTVTLPTNGTITGSGINCGTGGSDCAEVYADGTVVPLVATPDAGYALGGWTGACTGTGACSVTMTAARTVGATFTPPRFTLTVVPPTGGTITASGINCGTGGSDCTQDYDQGTVVPMTATPATGYDFVQWTGSCTGTGPCSVTMTAPRSVGATFQVQRYTLTVTLPTNGTITGSGIACGTGGGDCSEMFDYGTVVPLTATPDTGFALSSWTGACSGTGACSATMTAARTVGATFAVARHTLTVTPPTGGTITATGINCGAGGSDCTETYDYGTVVPLTATPSTGYDFGGWTGACTGTGACSATMTAARTVGATFTIQRYTLTVTLPTNGTITATGINCGTGGSDCSEAYDYGTVVPLTATPATGYSLSGWTGVCSGTGACSATMTAARTVGATFALQSFTLTVTPPTNGTITGTGIACGTGGSDCTETFTYGTVVPLTATPDANYDFGGWTGACTGTGACSATMTAARTVGATFTLQRFTLTVTPPTNGTVTATGINCGAGGSDCTESYDTGTIVPLTATPAASYTFGGWTGACTGTGPCSVTMNQARTVGATFNIQRFTLTVTLPTNGTITGTGIACGTGGSDCTQDYDSGTVVPLTATPGTGYSLSAWTGACTGTGACSVTMTQARTVGATFAIQRHTLTVTPPTNGTITGTGIACGTGGSDCTETYDYGTGVVLTATPNTGYDLGSWTGACTGTGACSLAMTQARTVGATFTVQSFTLTVTPPTNGTITASGINCGAGGVDCLEAYDYGTAVALTATPVTGYQLDGWTGACTGTGACSVAMTQARTVGATFGPRRYTLTVTPPTHGTLTAPGIACGTGGSDCTQDYDYGTVVAVAATPAAGYRFRAWSGACTGTGSCSLTMTTSRTVGATFVRAFLGTKTTPGSYEGPGFSTNAGPVEGPVEGPRSSPAEGSLEGPLEGPLQSLQEGPRQSHREGPVEGPFESPRESPNAPGNAMATPPAATVHVGGDVRRPGAYAWSPGMTVRQLVAAAGGLTPKADGGRLEIVREGTDRHPEPKRTLEDLVQAGDSIVLR